MTRFLFFFMAMLSLNSMSYGQLNCVSTTSIRSFPFTDTIPSSYTYGVWMGPFHVKVDGKIDPGKIPASTSVISRGFVWGTKTKPALNLATKSTNGTGTGDFTTTITDLKGGTTYYVRAYAVTNNMGISYGNEFVYTHLDIGTKWQGGKIAYLFQPEDGTPPGTPPWRGLIIADTCKSVKNHSHSSGQWFIDDAFSHYLQRIPEAIPAPYFSQPNEGVGAGPTNTRRLYEIFRNDPQFANLAVVKCEKLVFNGYSDWFLPSKGESSLLYKGNWTMNVGWSSSYSVVGVGSVSYCDMQNGCTSKTTGQVGFITPVRFF